MTHRGPQRFLLPRWARRGVYAVSALCFGSGAAWLWLHHFVTVDGAFGPETSPLEHPMLVVHGIAAMAMTWLFGVLWLAHVRRAWHARRNRRSGGAMVAFLSALCLSGLGLYYLGDEQLRAWTSTAHWLVGFVAATALPIHIWRGRRAVRRTALTVHAKRTDALDSAPVATAISSSNSH